jgi:AraC-like DNA-binding protein
MRHTDAPLKADFDPELEVEHKAAILLHKRSKDLDTGWHTHSKAQLLYAEDGITRLYTAQGNFLLPAHHCAWIPAHMVHAVTSSSPQLFLRTLYFNIEPTLTHSFYTELSVFQVSTLLREMIVYTERWAQSTQYSIEETNFLHTLKLILPDLQGVSLGLRLPTSEHPKVKESIDYILDNLSEKIAVDDIAKKMHVSTRTIARLFQQELDMSFSSFLKVARIIKALEWLSQPGANVSETAYKVGYDSVPSFSNSFLEVVGSRPQAFLQKQQ